MGFGQGVWLPSRGFTLQARTVRRSNYKTRVSSSLPFLEEEIHILRSRMEELFEQEQSLTSAPVIEASNQLDLKINEYMERTGSR